MGSGFKFYIKTEIESPNKITKAHGLDENGSAVRFLRDDVDRLCNPFIPFKTGGLRRLKTYPNNYSIKYTSPDARLHYHGKLMLTKNGSSWAKKGEKKFVTDIDMKYHTSGTGPKWDRLMVQRRGNELEKDLQNFIKKEC